MKYYLTLALLIPAAVVAGWWVRGALDPQVQAADDPAYSDLADTALAKDEAPPDTEPLAEEAGSGRPRNFSERLALIDSIGENPSMENIKAALETLLTMRSSELRSALQGAKNEHARRLIIDRWVELDPGGVLRYIGSSSDREYTLVRELMAHWSRTDPKRAIAAVEEMPENMRGYAYDRLLEYMGAQEPERILSLIQSGKAGGNEGSRYYRLMAKWGEEDPAAAFAAIRGLPEKDQTIAYRGYFDGLVKVDPYLAVDQAEQVSQNFTQRKEILASLYADWMEIDMDAAFASLGEIPSATLRGNLLRRYAYSMPRNDPEKLMALIDQHADGRWEREIVGEFMRDMARYNPTKAAELIDNMPYGDALNDAVYRLMDSWSDDDPVSALAWAETLPPGPERNRAISEGLTEYARLYPEKAFDYLYSQPPEAQDDDIWRRMAWGLADNPIRGMELIAAIEDDNLYHQMQTRLIQGWARNDPQAAIAFSQEYEIDLSPQAGSIAYDWSRRDPQAAFEWSMSLESENTQRDAVRNVARNWISHNSLAASEAIAEMEPGKVQDAAIHELVDKMRYRDPVAAFDWAQGATDENERVNLAITALRSWKDRDPAAAAQALRQSDLTVEQINKIRESVGLE